MKALLPFMVPPPEYNIPHAATDKPITNISAENQPIRGTISALRSIFFILAVRSASASSSRLAPAITSAQYSIEFCIVGNPCNPIFCAATPTRRASNIPRVNNPTAITRQFTSTACAPSRATDAPPFMAKSEAVSHLYILACCSSISFRVSMRKPTFSRAAASICPRLMTSLLVILPPASAPRAPDR